MSQLRFVYTLKKGELYRFILCNQRIILYAYRKICDSFCKKKHVWRKQWI